MMGEEVFFLTLDLADLTGIFCMVGCMVGCVVLDLAEGYFLTKMAQSGDGLDDYVSYLGFLK